MAKSYNMTLVSTVPISLYDFKNSMPLQYVLPSAEYGSLYDRAYAFS